jgi:hypothetical protein
MPTTTTTIIIIIIIIIIYFGTSSQQAIECSPLIGAYDSDVTQAISSEMQGRATLSLATYVQKITEVEQREVQMDKTTMHTLSGGTFPSLIERGVRMTPVLP